MFYFLDNNSFTFYVLVSLALVSQTYTYVVCVIHVFFPGVMVDLNASLLTWCTQKSEPIAQLFETVVSTICMHLYWLLPFVS